MLHSSSRFLAAGIVVSLCAAGCLAQAQTSQAPQAPGNAMQNQQSANAPLLRIDFTKPAEVARWNATHGIGSLTSTRGGMALVITGNDPYAIGPAVNLPWGVPLWARIRLQSSQAGNMQLFYWNQAQGAPSEERNISAFVSGRGVTEEVLVPLPALGPVTSFRIDPPGDSGTVTIESISFEERVTLAQPAWPKPVAPRFGTAAAGWELKSGDATLRHDGRSSMGFTVSVSGRAMANGLTRSLIGTLNNKKAQWTPLGGQNTTTRVAFSGTPEQRSLRETSTLRDVGGATWTITREYSPAARAGAFDVTTSVQVSQARNTVFLPLLVILPGVGNFGAQKTQAVFPGLEYLANEPSSNLLDITTAEHKRQVPDNTKITIPMMAIAADNRTISLLWEPQQNTSALFDSPDRLFKSGGHAMGLLLPGSDGFNREEGNLLPYRGLTLRPNAPYVQRATIAVGSGASVVPALEDYVARRGLPPLPDAGLDLKNYVDLAARGWLDSRIREDDMVRHAFWPGFGPAAAADAPMLMEWLAQHTSDTNLQTRLRQTAPRVLARVTPENYLFASVSHVTYPVVPLVYGNVLLNARRAAIAARDTLAAFQPDGSIRFQRDPKKADYGKTHFAPDANGLTATSVRQALTMAAFSGDRALIDSALEKLRALDKFQNDVPRGAQSWEVPLHTPDILASAQLVDVYLRGYELTGEARFLEEARYWAWTGVPFVYLRNPTPGKVGIYGTIAVFGATEWVGSWFARPVQWNGLVYSDALYRLAEIDASGPWRQLADGITLAGIQHTWKENDAERQGLLPDFFLLKPQVSDGPAINPGTVQANAVNLFRQTPLYQMRAFRQVGFFVHAPGRITPRSESAGSATFSVEGWPQRPYFVLISGLRGAAPRVLVNGRAAALTAPNEYSPAEGRLVLQISGKADISVTLPR